MLFLLFFANNKVSVKQAVSGRNAGYQSEKLAVFFDIDIRAVVRQNHLGFDHLVVDLIPVIGYCYRVADREASQIVKEDPSDIACMSGNGAVGVCIVERKRGACKMRRAVAHHIIVRSRAVSFRS